MKNNQTIFAVNDNNVIMPLIVIDVQTDVEDLDGWLEVTTELADKKASREHSGHHQAYFRKLFIEPNGTSSRAGVFETKEAAIKYAEKSIESKIRRLQSQIDSLNINFNNLRNT
jgi:hypothetical protein